MPTAATAPRDTLLLDAPRREFRAAAEYRRSLLYVAVGGCVMVSLVWLLPGPVNAPPVAPRTAFCAAIFIGLPLAAWLYLTTWRLRVDHVGLWRKRLGSWTCWTWDFIEKERVRYDRRHGFLWCSARPWTDRLLGFAVLSPADSAFVLEVFLRLSASPDDRAAAIPSEPAAAQRITIRTSRWTCFEFDSNGVAIKDGRRMSSHPWDSVDQVRIERTEQQAVVHRFRIRLNSECEVKGDLLFVWVDGIQDWTPHKQDRAWFLSLQRLVPQTKWKCFQTWGELKDWEEAEWRFSHWNSRRIIFRRIKRYLSPLPPLLLSWKFVPGMWAIANDPFFPQPWRTIAILCALYTMFQPAVLFWILGRSGERAMNEKMKEALVELERLARHSSEKPGGLQSSSAVRS